jgi:transglutaminase-like putative cysteine protease
MTWRLRIMHRSGYNYAAPVIASYNEARMTPTTDLHQTTVSADVNVDPAPASVHRYWDYWGTQVTAFDLHRPHELLEITSSSVVETQPPEDPAEVLSRAALCDEKVRDRSHEFLVPTAYTPADDELVAQGRELADGLDAVDAVLAISKWVHAALRYEQGVTAVHTSAVEALETGSGVCQDYAHLALVLLRAADIPSRYVSGYFHPITDAARGEAAVGQSHAWIEAYVGTWWGHDPTNDLPIGEQHVIVGRGRDYADVPPLRGVFSGGASSALGVDVAITRES